ncbi:MAG: hypothetical protein UHK60_01705, partial [Acutalibacteraceae bacterium]|nr:hypothetical protein [Acutalibacteraceae bacterium]
DVFHNIPHMLCKNHLHHRKLPIVLPFKSVLSLLWSTFFFIFHRTHVNFNFSSFAFLIAIFKNPPFNENYIPLKEGWVGVLGLTLTICLDNSGFKEKQAKMIFESIKAILEGKVP